MPPGTGHLRAAGRPHRAPWLEDAANRRIARWLWARGWRTSIEPYPGYGAPGWVRVLARTVLSPPRPDGTQRAAQSTWDEPMRRVRGWRGFAKVRVKGARVEVHAGTQTHHLTSDRRGYVDAVVAADLPAGWHDVELVVATGAVTAPVFVVDPEVRSGIVSDIDDTVMVTSAPRPFLAVWNTFVLRESARRSVPGMAPLYQRLLRDDPSAPVLYLSSEAWNAAPALGRFLRRNGYPAGPLLLTDWGPTRTGLLRDGVDHKRAALRRLVREFPQIRWLLVGDDGQRDPEIYTELAAEQPAHVRGVAIRQLTDGDRSGDPGVPLVAARDGTKLAEALFVAGIDLTRRPATSGH